MTTITDEYMRQMLTLAKGNCIVILESTPKKSQPGSDKIVWEHGRRNFALRAEGVLPVVCPIFAYEAHPCRSFPGTALP